MAAAFELSGRGIPFQLLEASDRVGGLIQTERVDGYTIDAGADSMLATKPAARALCEDLGLGSQLQTMTEPRTAFVLARDRLFALPSPSVLGLPLTTGAAARYALLPLAARLRVPLEPCDSRRGTAKTKASRRCSGGASAPRPWTSWRSRCSAAFTRAMSRQLSVRSLFPALAEAERSTGSVLRSLSRRPLPPGGMFLSLRGGNGDAPATIASALPAGAVRLRRGRSPSGDERRRMVASMPTTAAPARLQRRARSAGSCRRRGCSNRSTQKPRTCARAFATRQPSASRSAGREQLSLIRSRGSGFVVAGGQGRFRVTACSWVSSKWEGRVPEGHVLLRAFIGGVARSCGDRAARRRARRPSPPAICRGSLASAARRTSRGSIAGPTPAPSSWSGTRRGSRASRTD